MVLNVVPGLCQQWYSKA